LHILFFTFLDSRRGDNNYGMNGSKHYPNTSHSSFRCESKFETDVSKYMYSAAFFMSWICPAFWWRDINMYLVLSAFTSRLASIRA
jgi:hypothetical protein